jgi:hypothetical protein
MGVDYRVYVLEGVCFMHSRCSAAVWSAFLARREALAIEFIENLKSGKITLDVADGDAVGYMMGWDEYRLQIYGLRDEYTRNTEWFVVTRESPAQIETARLNDFTKYNPAEPDVGTQCLLLSGSEENYRWATESPPCPPPAVRGAQTTEGGLNDLLGRLVAIAHELHVPRLVGRLLVITAD